MFKGRGSGIDRVCDPGLWLEVKGVTEVGLGVVVRGVGVMTEVGFGVVVRGKGCDGGNGK